ncbi:hypothetical protein F0562_028228 [Nyssa sinensis]|uniref:Leucine-rich repeat-containing N-terminal plant-type domain-containing protein n=1 Tax=Nyssa sinensis TaxID=561372 RepID=A0A5J5B7C2_9ASTE|nr:hypothetical protein F0562_028228 [Nyssa sinensis]
MSTPCSNLSKLMGKICFLFVLLLSCSMACLARTMSNLTTDQSALLAFKAHISVDPYDVLANNWSTTASVCNWIGVSCGVHHQRVTALNLSDMGLRGTIAPHLGNLSFLVSLVIFGNEFHGYLPKELSHLHRIKRIDLGYNSFTGELPSWFGMLPGLQQLYLDSNNFTVNSLSDSLPADMCNLHLPKLRELYITSNQLDGEIPSGLYKCKELQYLSLSDNEFSGSISRDIGNLTMLKELYLGGNNLEELEVWNVANDYRHNKAPSPDGFNMDYIKKGWKSIKGDVRNFMKEFHANVRLVKGLNSTFLVLLLKYDNPITLGAIPDEIGNLNLERLSLPETKFAGLIPEKIFNISTMKHIDLSMNQFIGHLPSSMGLFLPNLERLYISYNELSGAFPISITNASKLTILDMTSNSFSGSIPDTLGNLRLLKRLVISNNSLTGGPSIRELGFLSSLTNCRNLEILAFSLNPLNGAIPISFGNLSTSLRVFQAYGCKIKGDFPNGIGNLSSLEAISLDINEFTGFIPKTLGRLKQLEVLYLEHNRLQGPIPDDLCQLNKLGNLFLSDNKLYGSIPTCLGEVKSLRNLYLNSNKLTSTIPSTLWSLTDLLGLNLSSNYLSGHITSNIGNLKVITQLGLSWNQFSGEGELMAQTMTLATIGYMAPEYGIQGIVSTRGDVYSYGVTLMETFTRKKPTDELFSEEMSLKHWVNEALHGSIIEAVDTNLIGSEDEHFYAKKLCLSSILGLAMDCSTDSPEERINMQDVLARLQKIKIAYLKNI